MTDVPRFQQSGIDLLLRLLEDSAEPVHLMSFGSARPIAVAFNRSPGLLREKVARVHLSAGSTTLDYLEWNVYLDPTAMRRVIDSGLPLSLYPCAAAEDCYSYDRHNTIGGWRSWAGSRSCIRPCAAICCTVSAAPIGSTSSARWTTSPPTR